MNVDNLDYCYKLNLPNIEEAVLSLDEIKGLVPKDFNGYQIFYPDPQDIFRPEWLLYKGLSWDYASIFFRSGKQKSILHKDNPHDTTKLHWGVNWVYGEDSTMEYWEDEKIKNQKIIYDSGGKTTVLLETDWASSRSYKMSSGVYLINASVPHKITNLSSNLRIAVSLRSKKFRYENPKTSWQAIIEKFQDVILV